VVEDEKDFIKKMILRISQKKSKIRGVSSSSSLHPHSIQSDTQYTIRNLLFSVRGRCCLATFGKKYIHIYISHTQWDSVVEDEDVEVDVEVDEVEDEVDEEVGEDEEVDEVEEEDEEEVSDDRRHADSHRMISKH